MEIRISFFQLKKYKLDDCCFVICRIKAQIPFLKTYFFVLSSDVEARGLQIQLEQTVQKDLSPFSTLSGRSPGKSRSTKSKHRRSPYSQSTSNQEFPTEYEMVPEMSSSDFCQIIQPNTHYEDPMRKFEPLYGPAYPGVFHPDYFPHFPYHSSTQSFADESLQCKVESEKFYPYKNMDHLSSCMKSLLIFFKFSSSLDVLQR